MRATATTMVMALLLGACAPDIEEGKFSCTTNAECPTDWHCRADGRCWSTPGTGPMDAGIDSGTDAGSDSGTDAGAADAGCAEPGSTVDLLVMIDDSNSMTEEQESIAQALPELVRALATGDVEPDGERDFTPAEDLHVGVVSSDMGTGGFSVPSCVDSDFGDDGILQHDGSTAVAGCAPTYPDFLEYRPGDGLSGFRMDFACIARLGTGGCAFEQPLEAVLKALTPSTSPLRFYSGTRGHADAANAGFLRDGSILVTLVVTDEDDCSAADPTVFDPGNPTYSPDLNLRCSQNPEALHPISRFVDGLRALRPSAPEELVFAAVVGVPVALEDATYADILDAPEMQFRIDPGTGNLTPSCDVPGRGRAMPPRRIVETARELDLLGSRVALGSICQADYSGTLAEVLSEVRGAIEARATCP